MLQWRYNFEWHGFIFSDNYFVMIIRRHVVTSNTILKICSLVTCKLNVYYHSILFVFFMETFLWHVKITNYIHILTAINKTGR